MMMLPRQDARRMVVPAKAYFRRSWNEKSKYAFPSQHEKTIVSMRMHRSMRRLEGTTRPMLETNLLSFSERSPLWGWHKACSNGERSLLSSSSAYIQRRDLTSRAATTGE
eukprot:2423733-Rhodomonas_salina.1